MQTPDSIPTRGTVVPALDVPLEEAIHSSSPDVLKRAAADPALNEDISLALLSRADLPPEVVEQLSKHPQVLKSRKAKLAIVTHPRAPRYVSIALARQLFTFDLMKVALVPAVPADVKVAADEVLINRMETISLGERLALARRGSGRIAARLLSDTDPRVMRTVLENVRLTEAMVVRALRNPGAYAEFVLVVCTHPKWSLRADVRIALLRHPKTPLHKSIEIARSLPAAVVRDALRDSQVAARVKAHLLEHLQQPW